MTFFGHSNEYDRRIEDVIEGKQLGMIPVNIRMHKPDHGNRSISLEYAAWIVIPESAFVDDLKGPGRSIFLDSSFAIYHCNVESATFIPECHYKIPTGGRGSTPLSADKRSDYQHTFVLLVTNSRKVLNLGGLQACEPTSACICVSLDALSLPT